MLLGAFSVEPSSAPCGLSMCWPENMNHSDQTMNKPRLNILLIEDNIALAKQICRFMEGLNWRVDYSEKGTSGITLALENTFDVIV